jgi:hypothetical protein
LEEMTAYGVAAVTVRVIHKAAARGFNEGERPLVW